MKSKTIKKLLFRNSKTGRLKYSKNEVNFLINLDKKSIWHPFTQMKDWQASKPLMIASAKGHYLTCIENKKYLDGISSLWVNVLGHSPKQLKKWLKKQRT